MKILSLFALLLLSLNAGQEQTTGSIVFDVAATASEHAAITQSNIQPNVEDHYGNPDQFIQYIIRVPPIHV